jgi:hypothetical protein
MEKRKPFLERALDGLSENKTAIALFVTAAIAFFGLSMAGGCDLRDMVRVKVPDKTQQALNQKSQVTLRQAEPLYEDYMAWAQNAAQQKINEVEAYIASLNRAGDEFAENIEQGWQWYDLASSITNMGVTALIAGVESAPGIPAPIGGLLVAALAGGARIATKRPGTSRLVQQEKEDSYNKGREVGAREARDSMAAIAGKLKIENGNGDAS